jgi:hypothetical protein
VEANPIHLGEHGLTVLAAEGGLERRGFFRRWQRVNTQVRPYERPKRYPCVGLTSYIEVTLIRKIENENVRVCLCFRDLSVHSAGSDLPVRSRKRKRFLSYICYLSSQLRLRGLRLGYH